MIKKNKLDKTVAVNSERITRLEEQGKTIVSSLVRVEEAATVLRHIVEGNGNPGLKTDMQLLKQSVSTIHETLVAAAAENLDAIKRKRTYTWQWWLAIGMFVLSQAAQFILR